MNNLTLLDNYDMVVAYPLATINSEFQKLVQQNTIQSTIILYRTVDDSGNYHYSLAANPQAIPKGAEYIQGTVVPQLQIDKTGNIVILVLEFNGGTALFADLGGFGPHAKIQQYNMAGWRYGLPVNLDLAQWASSNSGTSGNVRDTLNRLIAGQFNVEYLFLDFVSSDLHTTDSTTTNCPKEMTSFMTFYFSHLNPANNPYILGYSINSRPASQYSGNLPPSLKPSTAGYAIFHDGGNPALSNLSFIMDTQGGHNTFSGQPATPDSNWFVPGDNSKGKLVISHNCLLEKLILQPFYQSLQQSVHGQIASQISVGAGNSYAAAKQQSGLTWTFIMSNVTGGDDQYVNKFTVTLANQGAGVQITFNGGIAVYKEVSKNDFFCTAHANASSSVNWTGTVNLFTSNGVLQNTSSFHTTSSNHNSDKNTCAKAFSWIGKILGGVVDVFTGWSDGGFVSNLASNAFSVNVPGVGSLQLALNNFMPALGSINLLPSGSTYKATSVGVDSNGNIYVSLS